LEHVEGDPQVDIAFLKIIEMLMKEKERKLFRKELIDFNFNFQVSMSRILSNCHCGNNTLRKDQICQVQIKLTIESY
jgi:hypothetical protein